MKVLTLFALESETQNLFTKVPLVYTGVGKVNAGYAITKAIYEQKPDIILNFGTAGSKKFNYGDIVLCNKFVQRDMNATAFGYKPYETPNDTTPVVLEYSAFHQDIFNGIGTCGTGDSFETHITGKEVYDIVDMEAYVLAKIAQMESIPFVCVKFVSDGADSNAPQNWNESLTIGAKKMKKAYDDLQEHLKKYF